MDELRARADEMVAGMGELELVYEALRRGYGIWLVKANQALLRDGLRVSSAHPPPDHWADAANKRLWLLQRGEVGHA